MGLTHYDKVAIRQALALALAQPQMESLNLIFFSHDLWLRHML